MLRGDGEAETCARVTSGKKVKEFRMERFPPHRCRRHMCERNITGQVRGVATSREKRKLFVSGRSHSGNRREDEDGGEVEGLLVVPCSWVGMVQMTNMKLQRQVSCLRDVDMGVSWSVASSGSGNVVQGTLSRLPKDETLGGLALLHHELSFQWLLFVFSFSRAHCSSHSEVPALHEREHGSKTKK